MHLGSYEDVNVQNVSPDVWKFMLKNYGIQSIIDVGCGTGVSTTWFLMHGIDTICIEANPMAMLVEQAGGLAYTGEERIMDIQPNDIHQRVAVILGSKNEVEACLAYHK